MKTKVFGLMFATGFSSLMFGQASPTASKTFDLQAGAGLNLADSDYGSKVYRGAAVYATLDFSSHFGGEIDFHQATSQLDKTYERTYEIGVRYHRTYGRFVPYAKGLYGRGVFNFVFGDVLLASLAYNEFALGAGTDYRLLPWLNLRADYEYQMWHNFPPNGLTPQVLTLGAAYHFPGELKKGERFR